MTQAQNPYDFLPQAPSFTLRSDDVTEGGTVPVPQRSGIMGAGGEDRSPHLAWEGFPEGTKSFAVTCLDPDAPTGSGFWHWAVFDIPASVTELTSGAGDADGSGLPRGATMLRTDAGIRQYVGAAPPPGHGPHRYIFVVHALDVESLEVGDEATPAFLGFNMFGHTLGRAMLTPVYEIQG